MQEEKQKLERERFELEKTKAMASEPDKQITIVFEDDELEEYSK